VAEDCNRPVSQWSDAERLAWGAEENRRRKEDLARVSDENSLTACQLRAKKRRNAIGASAGQAFSMVRDAQIHAERLAKEGRR
jgi:hypothetical protein